MACDGVVTDAAGKGIATVSISKKCITATATLSVGEAAVYTAEKYTTVKFLLTITDSAGKVVAKVHQPGMDPRAIELVAAPGVDILAVAILTSAVGAASSGSAAGGMAGAGIY